MSRAARGAHQGPAHAVCLLGASTAGALLLATLRVPAGVLVGAVLGSVLANRMTGSWGGPRPLPTGVRVLGLGMLGAGVGTRIDGGTLNLMSHIAVPLLGAFVVLLVLDVALSVLLVSRYQVDPITAVFACLPGGLSGIAVVAHESGARMGVVLAVHTVRILTVLLVVVPLLVTVAGSSRGSA